MNAFMSIGEWWAGTLWLLSWQIGVLVGVVWAASWVFRRSSPNFRYWLWCIVLLRLCLPVTVTLPGGVSGDVRRVVESSAPALVLVAEETVVQPARPGAGAADTAGMAASLDDVRRPGRAGAASDGVASGWPLRAKLALGWAAVFLGILGVVLAKSLRAGRLIEGWPEVARPELLELVDSLRTRCSIGRGVRVRTFPAGQPSQGPAVVGVMRPTILLPAHVAEQWRLDELEPVFLHELAHVRRWDLLVNWVQMIVQAAYFFHPLVWLVNSKIRQERELVCDDLAVLLSGGQCKRYSQSFVRVLEETSNSAPAFDLAAAGMTERRKPLARRIIRMMGSDYRLYRPLGWLSAFVLLFVSAVAVAVAAERVAQGAGPGADVSTEVKGPRGQHEVVLKDRPRPVGKASLAGKVVDAETGEPIVGSTLFLLQTDTLNAMFVEAADDGSYEFKDIPGGNYILRVNSAPGHVAQSENGQWTSLQLGKKEQKRDAVFRLRRGYCIVGHVTAEDGNPLPADDGFTVVAWVEGSSDKESLGRYRMAGQGRVTQDGSYCVDGLDNRPVYVQFIDFDAELEDNPYPPVYYPGTFSREEATQVTFDKAEGNEVKAVDIPLRRTGGLVLEGVVSHRDTGEPIPKALVVVHSPDVLFDRATAYSDARGRFQFECLGPGEFQVQVDATPQGFVRTRKLVALKDATSATRLDVTLTPGATLSGVIVQEDGSPWLAQAAKEAYVQASGSGLDGAYGGVWSRYAPGRVLFSAMPYLRGEGDYEVEAMGFPGENSFLVSGVRSGDVRVVFNPFAEGKRVVRIDAGGKDILGQVFKVEPGQVIDDIRIVIGDAGAQGRAPTDGMQDPELRVRCTNNLKQMGLVFWMFVNEDRTETFPALSSEPGQLMFSAEAKVNDQAGVFPEYLTDMSVLVCPASDEAAGLDAPEVRDNPKSLINDNSYVYLAYAVTSDEDVEAFAEAYRAEIAKGVPPLEDLSLADGKTLYRLRGGVERLVSKSTNDEDVADAASRIPVLIERPAHHEAPGGHVLYLDGTVRWVRSGEWPMTKRTMGALERMMSLLKR